MECINEFISCFHQFVSLDFSQFGKLKKQTNFLLIKNSFFFSVASWKRNRNKFSLKNLKIRNSRLVKSSDEFVVWFNSSIHQIYLGKNQRESNLITCRIIHQANVISEKTCYRAVGGSENLKGQIVIQGLQPFGGEAGSFCFYFCQNLVGQLSHSPRFRRACAKDVLQRFVCLSLEPSLRIAVSRDKSAKVNEGFHFKHFSICSTFFLRLQNSKTKLLW